MNFTYQIYYRLVFPIFFLLFTFNLFAQDELPRLVDSKDYAVMLSAEVSSLETSITLTWDNSELAYRYTIKKRELNKPWWSQDIADIDGTNSSWTDTDIEKGVIYEYQVLAHSEGAFNVTGTINEVKVDSTVARTFQGFGYITAGVEAPPSDDFSEVLLLVDETMMEPLKIELERLGDDLAKEGWTVVMKTVQRTEKFNGYAVKNTKSTISQEYIESNYKLTTVFLIGRVAVPYSGNLNPDGHPNHKGAWPADVYYGIMKEQMWSDDEIDNDSTASRQANKNIIGDGKFDASLFTTNDVVFQIGRVDFYDMPLFYDETYANPEIELVRNYLNKDHLYRTNQLQYGMRALVQDNFKVKVKMYEGFASSGWRNFAVMVGHENVQYMDWLSTLSAESYLWSYGCGGGSYTSCKGIANSQQIADTESLNAIFCMIFGSYFGDWDSQNNFLRAPLCTEPSALTSCWSARPSWFMHHMGLGKTIGYSTAISQNNYSNYTTMMLDFNPFQPYIDWQNPITLHYGRNMVHTALMGDPTLRLRMATVPMAENLSIVQPPGKFVDITWEAPSEGDVDYYNVFSAPSKWGPWTKLNDEPLYETELIDENLVEGEVFYMVKSYHLQEVPSGSYYNDGIGIIRSAGITDVEDEYIANTSIVCSPNPARENLNISLYMENNGNALLQIFDISGNLVKEINQRTLAQGMHSLAWNLTDRNGNSVSPGVYYVKLMLASKVIVEKIVVMP